MIKLARIGKDFRPVIVDNNGRLPLKDPIFRALLTPEGKSTPVKLFGNVYYFSLCPLDAWDSVQSTMNSALA
jgi:hypothetical protein